MTDGFKLDDPIVMKVSCPKCGTSTRLSSSVRDGVYRMVGDADYAAQESPILCPTCDGLLDAEFDHLPGRKAIAPRDDDKEDPP